MDCCLVQMALIMLWAGELRWAISYCTVLYTVFLSTRYNYR